MDVIVHYDLYSNSFNIVKSLPPTNRIGMRLPVLSSLYDMPHDEIECVDVIQDVYNMVEIEKVEVLAVSGLWQGYASETKLTGHEKGVFRRAMMLHSSVDWALNASLDGLYFVRRKYSMTYTIVAYLRPIDYTFWRLKFAGV